MCRRKLWFGGKRVADSCMPDLYEQIIAFDNYSPRKSSLRVFLIIATIKGFENSQYWLSL